MKKLFQTILFALYFSMQEVDTRRINYHQPVPIVHYLEKAPGPMSRKRPLKFSLL